ncbi:LysE family translocator [Pseudomonas sp. 6D_7.1_Bac1]|uniref:LysE family translocator n=1 Tax=Pseudomonas sp. 6D_7.1_Bac1 TaxID=2971615 RepID=UPI0021C7E352|nr:LysE family translocator [Pseudomonas sp. 6D_7.1_Bac1]MCU1751843.1 LysE family translocator [Pseudomonas sp. 6D_7.1_Bac1]
MHLTFDLLCAFALFAFVSSITPGPNNTMLLASGVNFGFIRTIPHALGISGGFMIMVLAVGFGMGQIFTAFPMAYTVLRYAGAAYLLYLAWKIATSGPLSKPGTANAEPLGFLGAAAFQWVNPKSWVMAIGAISTYTPSEGYFYNVVVIALVFAIINIPCVFSWASFGSALRNVLKSPRNLVIFNITMAGLLVISLYPLLLSTS